MEYKDSFKALFDHATEGILIINSQGTITIINPSGERLFGYGHDELIGKPIETLIPKRFAQKHIANREEYGHNPHHRSMGIGMDLYGQKKDGTEFPVEISLSPYTNNKQEPQVIAFIIDITIRKRNEEALKKQKDQLEKLANELDKHVKDRTMILEEALHELEKSREELSTALEKEKELNELKSRFVSMASHEFRTPLATILSSLSLSNKYSDNGDKENQLRHTNRIKSAVTHMTDILNDTLSISRLEEGKITASPEMFNIVEFSRQVVQELQSVAKEEQQIHYHHKGDEFVFLDHKFLRNIYFNLISNAVKFSPEHSIVEVSSEVKDSMVEIRIKDNGLGIPEEDQEHLFERFFRARNATNIQGTGLGLNIVMRYVELMYGSIQFESQLEQGTTFIIKIPNIIE